ncbi:hypothetical protein ASG90_02810 [Nocardioides sp. Soil797]|nr:hypothetical protein ASG90_02810 [Nocardioides sp. Soil797]
MTYAARPVAGVLLLVLAVVLVFSTMFNAPGASADPAGAEIEAGESAETPSDSPSVDPSGDSSGDPSGEPTTDDPSDPATDEPTDEPSNEPSETGLPEEPTTQKVADAVFRWGLNDQSNAHSHNPQREAINFLSAGVANPGRPNSFLPRRKWSAKEGQVSIQKRSGDGYRLATWAGLRTGSDNRTPINSSSVFSGHTVVIKQGVGTVDSAQEDATITWRGTFTVLYYGGNTMFTVSDPVLTVEQGVGQVTAILGGYATSRTDGGWKKVTPKRVRIADLGKVDLGKENGFSIAPAYEGVKVTGSTKQDTAGAHSGAFPQPMITFLAGLETDQFWYSTGLSTDDTKVASPLTVSYDEANEITPTPTPEPSSEPTIDNPVNDAPQQPGAPAPRQEAPVAAPADRAPGLPAVVPEEQRQLLTPADLGEVRPVAGEITPREDGTRTWWLVGALLLAAALLLLVPARPRG